MRKILILLLISCLLPPAGAPGGALGEENAGFTPMAENAGRALLLNEETLQARWVDKASGQVWDTSVFNGAQGNKTVKSTQKSAALVSYFTNAKNATLGTMDSYSKSVQNESCRVTRVENGFEVRYLIGDDTFIIDDLPKAIRADKYAKLLEGGGWSSKERKTFLDNYRAVRLEGLEDEYMIRVKDDSLSALLIKQLWNLIFSAGLYTAEDMMRDNAAVHYERVYLPEIGVTLRYQLEGEDLVVTVPAGQITYTPENEVTTLELLPYFLSADSAQDGFMLVPDGSGALIYLNNQKLAATAYTARVYGEDALINANDYTAPKENVGLPVFGLKRGDGAMLAIIEQGVEIASIFANVSGRSDEFNRMAPRFLLREVESVSLAGNESITSPRYAQDVYTGDIVMRYRWMVGETVGYVDMAKEYRRYLLDRGILTEREGDPDAPFFAELLGAVGKDDFFLGIPYASSVRATTLSQAKEIYAALRAQGIRNIQMVFSGLFSGGIKHAALTSPALDGGMGGAARLRELGALLRENGDALYAGCYGGRAYSTRDFNRLTQASRKHDGEPAEVYVFGEPVLKYMHVDRKGYYVSPHNLGDYTQRALRALEQYGLDGLDLFDLGNTLVPDYKRNQNLSRIHATAVFEGALESYARQYRLMLDAPLLYALPYADLVTGLPMGDNGYRLTDAAVPFTQYVLEGCVAYSGNSWNSQAYLGLEQQLLWALESKSSPRFTFTWEKPALFANTNDMDYLANFSTQYTEWAEKAGEMYRAYNAFYQRVRSAQVTAHEIAGDSVRRVTYSNGVRLYVNYGARQAVLEGVSIPARGYVVIEEETKP